MSIENTIATLQREQTKAQTQADALSAAIKALGGSSAAPGKPARRRNRGGWPKGKPRGAKSVGEAANGQEQAAVNETAPAPASPIAEARAKRADKAAPLAAAAS